MPEGNDSTNNVNDLAFPDLPVPGEGSDDLEMPLELPDAAPAWMAALGTFPDEPQADAPVPESPTDLPPDTMEPAPITILSPRFDVLKEQISSRLQTLEVVTPANLELPTSLSNGDHLESTQSEPFDETPTEDPAWVTGSSPILEIPVPADAPVATPQAESVLDIPSRTFEFQSPVHSVEPPPAQVETQDSSSQSLVVEEPATIEMRSVEPEPIAEEPLAAEAHLETEPELSEPSDETPEVELEAEDQSFDLPDTLPEALEPLTQDGTEAPAAQSLEELITDIDNQAARVSGTFKKYQARTHEAETITTRKRYVVFSMADSKYAIPIANVVEMGRIPQITPVPYLPDWVQGVTNLRGDILSVIELRSFFGLPAQEQFGKARMLVVRSEQNGVTTGLIVDGVHGMRELTEDSFKPVTAAIDDQILRFLRGLSVQDEGLLLVLDLDGILSATEIRVS